MTRMYENNYPSLAQLALMLRGAGMMNPGYGPGWDRSPNPGYPTPGNQPATSLNAWATTQYNRPSAGGSHFPATPVQEVLPGVSVPWDNIFPGDTTAPEFFPAPPGELFPPVPGELPVPFDQPFQYAPKRGSGGRPRDPECDKEWADAARTCADHMTDLLEGKEVGDFGLSYQECLMGQVSERCGGNPVDYGPRRGRGRGRGRGRLWA